MKMELKGKVIAELKDNVLSFKTPVIIEENGDSVVFRTPNTGNCINGDFINISGSCVIINGKVISGGNNQDDKDKETIKSYILKESLRKLSVSGQSNLFSKDILELKKVSVSGQSSLKIENRGDIDVSLSGQSEINLKAIEALEIDIDCSGQSLVEIIDTNADKISFDISGQSKLFVDDSSFKKTSIDASGMSSIKFKKTDAGIVKQNLSGMSKSNL